MKKISSKLREKVSRQEVEVVQTYTKLLEQIPLLSESEEKEVATLAHQGNQEAIDRLVTGNLRFAFMVAKSYIGLGMPFEDLIQEANLGLTKAAKEYDPAQGVKFISYAVYKIQDACAYALSKYGRTVRIPRNKTELITKINRTIEAYKAETSTDEIDYEEIARTLKIDATEVQSVLEMNQPIRSMDYTYGEDETYSLQNILAGEDLADSKLLKRENKQVLCRLMHDTLTANQMYVIKNYYGIGSEPHTFAEIADLMSLSLERVRQIRNESLKTMRNKSHLYFR